MVAPAVKDAHASACRPERSNMTALPYRWDQPVSRELTGSCDQWEIAPVVNEGLPIRARHSLIHIKAPARPEPSTHPLGTFFWSPGFPISLEREGYPYAKTSFPESCRPRIARRGASVGPCLRRG